MAKLSFPKTSIIRYQILLKKLRRFVEAANLKGPIHIAGHSLGGSIALLYAGQYPFETKSLFLVDSGGIFAQPIQFI